VSIKNAITFINKINSEPEFRETCYSFKKTEDLEICLRENNILFNNEEFSDAINHLLIRCQTESQSDKVKEINIWFQLLLLRSHLLFG